MDMSSANFESVVRGHHIYKSIWNPAVGERLDVSIERDNAHDRYAVSVQRDSVIVGHVPREVAKVFKAFITHGGEVACEVTGRRKRGNGLEVPCVYHFKGKDKIIVGIMQLLKLTTANKMYS